MSTAGNEVFNARVGGTTPLLTGTGTVLLSGYSSGSYVSIMQPTAAGATLTIGSGITIHGGWGQVGNAGLGLVNQGTINADVSGQTLTVTGTNWTNSAPSVLKATAGTLSLQGSWSNPLGSTVSALTGGALTLGGTWSNAGVISINAGTLNLVSNFTTAQLGTVNRTGGTVNLYAGWNNTGNTYDLALPGDLGAVTLLTGSQITGGTVTSSNVATVGLTVPQSNSTTLSNVTLGANLTANSFATITVPDTLMTPPRNHTGPDWPRAASAPVSSWSG